MTVLTVWLKDGWKAAHSSCKGGSSSSEPEDIKVKYGKRRFVETLGKKLGPRECPVSEAASDGVVVRRWCEESRTLLPRQVVDPAKLPRPPYSPITTRGTLQRVQEPFPHFLHPQHRRASFVHVPFLSVIVTSSYQPARVPRIAARDACSPRDRGQARHFPGQTDH
jgi:hypothetical protein